MQVHRRAVPNRQHQHACAPQPGRAHRATRSCLVQSAPGDALRDSAEALQKALAGTGSDEFWTKLEPHFGTRAAAQLLQQAQQSGSSTGATLPTLPVLPSVQLPALPQLPSLPSLPQLPQLPSQMPSAAGFSELSGSLAQELERLFYLGHDTSSPALQPHFGTAAAQHYLQLLVNRLSSFTPGVQLPSPAGLLPGVSAEALAATWHATQQALSQGAAQAASSLPGGLSGAFAQQQAQLAAALGQLQEAVAKLPTEGMGGYDAPTLCLIAAGALAAVAASTPPAGFSAAEPIPDVPLSHEYSPARLAEHFRQRPIAVATRAAQVALEIAKFGLLLLGDKWTGRLDANQAERAVQLRNAIERLGPAYVKVAQALSTRVDLLPPEYFRQIQLLQDRVPPFPCEEALASMALAFGRPVEQVVSVVSERPVAAASLGQVYRATLRPELGGGDVAIKVQRPGVLESVSLDLYLMRQAAEAIYRIPEVKTDWASLIDNWAVRFLHEMDYVREAANARVWQEQMDAQEVEGVVTAEVRSDLSNDVVLTTRWMDGEKLIESRASDVRELCNTLLNAYLIQLLDTGFLHADPHPGNLIRTPDGKICVLDFGLMTEVSPEQRIALVEYIAHLTAEDWDNVARDLQTLGFIPYEVGDPVALGISAPLGSILSQLSGGGGATKLNIDAVMDELETLGRSYPFSIPPFFALILRAFSVIEGIALGVDPDYSIVMECLPYISRRLLTDDDPRVRKALRDVLYGGKTRLDVQRLARLSSAFSEFTTDGLAAGAAGYGLGSVGSVGYRGSASVPGAAATAYAPSYARSAPAPAPAYAAFARPSAAASATASTSSARSGTGSAAAQGASASATLDPNVKEALQLVFSDKGAYVQELLVEELVAAADALSREALGEVVRRVLGSTPAVLALGTVEALGPLRPLLLPLPTPLEILSRLQPAVALSDEDQEALDVVRGVMALLQQLQDRNPQPVTGGARGEGLAAAARELRPLVPELLPGVSRTADMFVRAFVRRIALRVAEAVQSTDYEQSMAALGFMPGASGLAGGSTSTSSSSSSSSSEGRRCSTGSVSSSFSGYGAGASGAGSLPSSGNQFRSDARSDEGLSAGQLVTSMVAAPFLLALAPLALLTVHQQQQQKQQ